VGQIGADRRWPQSPKPIPVLSLPLSLSLSLPFDIIDSDCTVRSRLLPLLHDSRLRTCFPRYDKQHDASDACNVADIMHMCRWYGTKCQDVFSNVVITIVVDARGKAKAKGANIGRDRGKCQHRTSFRYRMSKKRRISQAKIRYLHMCACVRACMRACVRRACARARARARVCVCVCVCVCMNLDRWKLI